MSEIDTRRDNRAREGEIEREREREKERKREREKERKREKYEQGEQVFTERGTITARNRPIKKNDKSRRLLDEEHE